MLFKPSKGIFVGGIVASFCGWLFFSMALAGTGEDANLMMLLAVGLSVAGLVMLCVGAARALEIIDAIPAAFRNLDQAKAASLQHPDPQQPQQSIWQGQGGQPPAQQGFTQPPPQG